MKLSTFRTITSSLLLMFSLAAGLSAQNGQLGKPRSEKLLNDLDVLIWSTAGTDKVTVRLRIHNGAAYDPRGKAGTFALLGDILFPEEGIREFFREDLDGDLSVEVTYDYVEVTGTARADAFLTVLETLAPALMNTEINEETTEKLKKRQLEQLSELADNPRYLAARKAAERLFGEFPYGRPVEGSPETIGNTDFVDLIYVRERFLTADNATLIITGDVRSDYAYLAARRLMGSWNKAGTEIPATFRLPVEPPKETEFIYIDGETGNRSAAAVETYPRKHRLYHASEVLARVLSSRMSSGSANGEGVWSEVTNRGYLLKGILTLVTEDLSASAAVPGGASRFPARKELTDILSLPVTPNEFEAAKAAYFGEMTRAGRDRVRADVETYRLSSAEDELAAVRDLKIEAVLEAAKEIAARPMVEVTVISRPPVVPDVPEDPKDPSRR